MDFSFASPIEELGSDPFSMFSTASEITATQAIEPDTLLSSFDNHGFFLNGEAAQASSNQTKNLNIDAGNKKKHACNFPGCYHRGHSERDVKRHYTARHENGTDREKFFCRESGCPRARKGWQRKDLRDRHMRSVHAEIAGQGAKDNSPARDQSAAGDMYASVTTESALENLLQSRPREDIIAELQRAISRERVLEAQRDEWRSKYEKLKSGVMIAVAVVE